MSNVYNDNNDVKYQLVHIIIVFDIDKIRYFAII